MKKYYKKDLMFLFIHYWLYDIARYHIDDEEYQRLLRNLNDYVISKLRVEHSGDIVDEYVVMEVEEKE